jgi:Icc-related predicted phosphoesterase
MKRRKFLKSTGNIVTGLYIYNISSSCVSQVKLYSELKTTDEEFEFAIIADTHIGPQKDSRYQNYLQSIKELNENHNCAFMSIVGDLVRNGQQEQYDNFIELTKKFEGQAILVHGNHDGRYPWKNFRKALSIFGGPEDKTFYSFDCGKWHFVSFPSLIEEDSLEEKELLSWFDADLKKNRNKPSMVFIHHHMLPIGLTQLEFYNHPYRQRKRILEIITKYGNVKYTFMGHVHNGIQTSVKTAWNYKGTNFVLVPTTVVPRPFGEEYAQLKEGVETGGYYLTLKVKGEDVSVFGHLNNVNSIFEYPLEFKEFKPELAPKWLKKITERETFSTIRNGSFDEGLSYWFTPFRYKTDENPAFVAKPDKHPLTGKPALYLEAEVRGMRWVFDEVMSAYQIVKAEPDKHPVLNLSYTPNYMAEHSGGFVCVTSFKNDQLTCLMLLYYGDDREIKYTPRYLYYNATYINADSFELANLGKENQAIFLKIPSDTNQIHDVKIDLKDLFEKSLKEASVNKFYDADRLLIEVGVYAGKTNNSHSSAWFNDIKIDFTDEAESSKIDNVLIIPDKKLFETEFGLKVKPNQHKLYS